MQQTLTEEIKQLIIDSLNLEGMTTADIDTDAPLFNDGLGLDSIDAL
ncbi:acyl carrier protein, partial [Aeromonas hydrophila]